MKKKTSSRRLPLLLLGIAVITATLALTLVQARRQSRESPFQAARAFQDARAVIDKGPRPAGSRAIEETRQYIVAELKKVNLEPVLDEFESDTPRGKTKMVNIRAIRKGKRPDTIAVTGHYDTKVFENARFLGANDGGSSTAVVLELARVTGNMNLEHTLEFIFFDGEEAVIEWTAEDSVYGSRHDVSRRYRDGTLRLLKALVLVDMIGDRNLDIRRESGSTGWLTDIVWATARSLGHDRHFLNQEQAIEDDHVPYLRAGIPAVDLIDFNYPAWHTPADTLDKISADSLKIVGDVVYFSLSEIDKKLLAPQ